MFARGEAPARLGVSSIVTPAITIPGNVSNIVLELFHQLTTDEGEDGAQVLVSVNDQPLQLVTDFTPSQGMHGAHVDPDDMCREGPAGSVPAWSGDLMLVKAEANLSDAPYNVRPGDTVKIHFRILVDSDDAGGGWDIEEVRLTGIAH